MSSALQRKSFLLLLALATIAFFAILFPFAGAIFWGVVLALLFAPLQRWLLRRLPRQRNLAAIATVGLILLVVILPLTLLAGALVGQATVVIGRIRSGELNFGNYLNQILSTLPQWVHDQLERLDLLDMAGLQQRLSESVSEIGKFLAPQAINIGQNTLSFVVSFGIMLYLLFFLLRDGAALAAKIRRAIPLADAQKTLLMSKFAMVVKATVKGNVAVAATQGLLGGLILWALGIQGPLLWGVLMAFLSLLPAVGAGLIWGPIGLYFLATGAIGKGIVLILFGVFVIGLVDNVLRPILVGKDTKMPDYVILISTLGGLSIFGLNGFVIGPLIAALFIAVWDLSVAAEARIASPAIDSGEGDTGAPGHRRPGYIEDT